MGDEGLETQKLRQLIQSEIQPLERRLSAVERHQAEADGARKELREHLDARLDRMEQAIIGRIEASESWIQRRRYIEQLVVGAGRTALLVWARRFLPFVLMLGGVAGLAVFFYSLMH